MTLKPNLANVSKTTFLRIIDAYLIKDYVIVKKDNTWT
jgi:hypothetical protein